MQIAEPLQYIFVRTMPKKILYNIIPCTDDELRDLQEKTNLPAGLMTEALKGDGVIYGNMLFTLEYISIPAAKKLGLIE